MDETPAERNTYLFSATMPREVERIAKNYLRNPQEISTGKKNQGADTVTVSYTHLDVYKRQQDQGRAGK